MTLVAILALAANGLMAFWVYRTLRDDGMPEGWFHKGQAATVITAIASAVVLAVRALF